jgi:hypothetical protein
MGAAGSSPRRATPPNVPGKSEDGGAGCGVLGHIAIEAIVHLDLVLLDRDVVEELAGLRVVAVDDGDDLQQRMEGR